MPLSSSVCHHGFYVSFYSHMCDLFLRLCIEFPAEVISASPGAANVETRAKKTHGFHKNSVLHSRNTVSVLRWLSKHMMGKTLVVFQLALCSSPDVPWFSEPRVHCYTESPGVNGRALAAVCKASTEHTFPASPKGRCGKIIETL